jgi:rubredoxin
MKCPNDGNTMRSMDEDWLCPVCFGRVPKGGDAKPVLKSSGLGELVYGKVQDPNSFEVPPAMVAYAKAVDNTKAAMVVPQRQFEAFISRIPRHALCPMCAAGTLYFDVQKKRWECTDVGGGNCGFGFDKAELIRAGGLDVLVSKVRNARRQPQFSMIDESVAVNFKAHYYTFRSEGQVFRVGTQVSRPKCPRCSSWRFDLLQVSKHEVALSGRMGVKFHEDWYCHDCDLELSDEQFAEAMFLQLQIAEQTAKLHALTKPNDMYPARAVMQCWAGIKCLRCVNGRMLVEPLEGYFGFRCLACNFTLNPKVPR